MSAEIRLSECTIVEKLAESVCKRLTRKVIANLQRLYGNFLDMDNFWEALCIQIQGDDAPGRHVFDEHVRELTSIFVEDLAPFEQEAIWLHTPEGQDWDCENEEDRETYPVFKPDITNYIVDEHVFRAAGGWSNARIRARLGNN